MSEATTVQPNAALWAMLEGRDEIRTLLKEGATDKIISWLNLWADAKPQTRAAATAALENALGGRTA